MLDSSIFRDEYWAKINLILFKPITWYDWWILFHHWKYPSVQLNFVVYLFVVGEWTVYFKTGEVPALTPHEPVYNIALPGILENFLSALGGFFSTPVGFLIIIGAFLLLVLIILAATGSLPVLATLWFSRRKRGG